MKKMTVLLSAVVFVFVFFASFASAKEVPITEENLPLLKGTWEGTLSLKGGSGSGRDVPRTLEIINDSLPLRGTYIMTISKRDTGTTPKPFENGVIKKGKLFIEWTKYYWTELSLNIPKKGKMELRGDLFFSSGHGSLLLYKNP